MRIKHINATTYESIFDFAERIKALNKIIKTAVAIISIITIIATLVDFIISLVEKAK